MDKWLSRWTAQIVVLVILISVVTWSTAEETTPSGFEGSETAVSALDVDLSQNKTLTVGYTGLEVAALKQRMFELGYFKTNTINESYTATTADYVKTFEKMNGLPVDGVADTEMQALFFSDKARKANGSLVVPEKKPTEMELALAAKEKEKERQKEQEKQNEINQRIASFLADIDLSQYQTLMVGYTGAEVTALKQRMYELDYFKANMVNDSYTAQTDAYVRKFEKVNGIPVDGKADPEMQALLFSDLAIRPDGSPAIPVVEPPLTEEEKKERTKRLFSEFLAGTGEFSDFKLERKLFRGSFGNFADLGFTRASFHKESGLTTANVQGVLLHHYSSNGNEFLALGVKNRKGERIVVTIYWPVKDLISIRTKHQVGFQVTNADHSFGWSESFYNEKDLSAALDSHISAVLEFGLPASPKNAKLKTDAEFYVKFFAFISKKTEANRMLLAGVICPSERLLDNFSKSFIHALNERAKIPEIADHQSFLDMASRVDELPFVINVYYQGERPL